MKIDGKRIVRLGIGPKRSVVGVYKNGSHSRQLTIQELNRISKYTLKNA